MADIASNNADPAILGHAGRDHYRISADVVDMSRTEVERRPARFPALPQDVIIDVNRTALVVIDMQKEFCDADGWLGSLGADVSAARSLVPALQALAAAARTASVPVIWLNWGVRPDRLNLSPGTQKTFNPDGRSAGLGDLKPNARDDSDRILQAGSAGAAVIDELRPAAEDILVDKHRLSGFWDTPLDAILRNLNIRTILFAGINADECVYATLMDANFHGYDTLLVEDAVATTSPDYCMQATLYNVRFCLGFTANSSDIISAIGEK